MYHNKPEHFVTAETFGGHIPETVTEGTHSSFLPRRSGPLLTRVARRAARPAVAGFLVMLAAACSGAGPELRPGGNGPPNTSIDGIPAVRASHPALLGGMVLCVTGPGSAVITAIKPIHPTGAIEVVDYATRPNPGQTGGEQLGVDYGTLRTHGFTASRTVNAQCGDGDSGQGDELGLELSVPQIGRAHV